MNGYNMKMTQLNIILKNYINNLHPLNNKQINHLL